MLVEDGVNQFLLLQLVRAGDIQLLGNVPEFSNLSAVQINNVVHVGFPLPWATLRSNFPEGARRLCTCSAQYKFTTTFVAAHTDSSLPQFDHLRIAKLAMLQVEAEQRAHPVKSLLTGRSGVEVNPTP